MAHPQSVGVRTMNESSTPAETEQAVIVDLQRRLEAIADPTTKEWFENYLKHAISYRGVKSPAVAEQVTEWRDAHQLKALPDEEQLALAASLIRRHHAEDKFAGTLYIQKYLLRTCEPSAILAMAEDLFAADAVFDWSTSDWFSMRVLAPLIKLHGADAAERIAGWHTAVNLWQRRPSIVPFRSVVKLPDYHPLIESNVAALVSEPERFIQTGIGWVVSDLSKSHPSVAAALVERHFDELSSEVIRRHTKYLPQHAQYRERKSRS